MRRRLAWAAAAAAAALLCGELLLRAIDFSAPVRTRPDRDLGWTLRPELREVSLHGARDRERILAKPREVYRIAVLGDEYSEAPGLPLAQAWWVRLEQALGQCDFQAPRRVEVLSFAVRGFGTAQQYVQLQTAAIRFQPDLVLLQFSRDDVRNNSFMLEPQKQRPFFMLDAKGALVIDDSFATSAPFRSSASFRHEALRKLTDRLRLLQLANFAQQKAPPAAQEAAGDRSWAEAWRITEALIAGSHDFARRNGAQLALVGAADPRLQAFAAARGIRSFALEALSATRDGHQAVADRVAERLCGHAPL